MKVKVNNRIEMTPCVAPIGAKIGPKMHLRCKKNANNFNSCPYVSAKTESLQ